MVHLSIILPVLNESSLISELVNRISTNVKLITRNYEIILIDDGSTDETWASIKNEALIEKRVKGVKFSKNFGHHYAITAGLQNSKGEWVVVMDSDLQDRPEVIPELYKKALEGNDIVFVSRNNRPEKYLYIVAQKLFYAFLRILSGINFDSTQANFSIINRKVVDAFKEFPENTRFYGSTILWLGFKRASLVADHGKRFSGKPSYTFRKRLNLAIDIILAYSDRPLFIAINSGLFISFSSILLFFWLLYRKLNYGFAVQGWTSVIASILLIGGMILTVIGIIGVYLSRVYREVKRRPLFIISDTINQNDEKFNQK
jgi:glycosyltransferase involved in cell wall biosynthesis